MKTEYLCIVIVAVAWGGYPLLSRATQVPGPLGALILTVCGLVPITLATLGTSGFVRPSNADLARLAVGGLLMGTGTAAFNYLATSRRLDASTSIPIVDTAMMLCTVLGAVIFFGEPMNPRKFVGLALLVAGILTLKPT